MNRCKLLLLFLVFAAAGCTDNVDTVTREYRATTNEAMDALTAITTEAHAKRMTVRIFKSLGKRYEVIGKKMEIVKSNRDKPEFVKEMLESDGLHLYLTDLMLNRQRYGLEITRLRNLYKQYVERERELLIAEGDNNPQVGGKAVCPELHEMLYGGVLEALRSHLADSPVVIQMLQLPGMKTANYEDCYKRFMERRPTFVPLRDIKLVQ